MLLLANAADPNPPPGCSNGVVKIALADGAQTCVISFDWGLGVHVSGPDGSGWFIISTYAWADPSPLTSWARYAGEILQVKLTARKSDGWRTTEAGRSAVIGGHPGPA